MITFCRKHLAFERVTRFEKDNPVTSCGQVIEHDEVVSYRIDKCRIAIERFLICRSILTGKSIEEVRKELVTFLIPHMTFN